MEEKKLKFIYTLFVFLAAVLLLSACGHASFNTESQSTIKTVKTSLNTDSKKPNKKSGKISFYLPFGYEIKDKKTNNVILKNGSKTYILFHNPEESSTSEVVFKASLNQYKKVDKKESFLTDKKYGFVIIKRLGNDMNELTVGMGGTKMTIQTKTASMVNDAKDMTEIVKSVVYNK